VILVISRGKRNDDESNKKRDDFRVSCFIRCVLACDTKKTTPTPQPAPNSALGDSPTLRGVIRDFAALGLEASTLKLKATAYGSPTSTAKIAEGTVAQNGFFSITLPGKSVLASVVAIGPPVTGDVCSSVTLEPATTKGALLSLSVWDETNELGQLLVAVPTDPNDLTSFK
jgi:hypothetical protein